MPSRYEKHNSASYCHMRAGNFDKALQHAQRCIDLGFGEVQRPPSDALPVTDMLLFNLLKGFADKLEAIYRAQMAMESNCEKVIQCLKCLKGMNTRVGRNELSDAFMQNAQSFGEVNFWSSIKNSFTSSTQSAKSAGQAVADTWDRQVEDVKTMFSRNPFLPSFMAKTYLEWCTEACKSLEILQGIAVSVRRSCETEHLQGAIVQRKLIFDERGALPEETRQEYASECDGNYTTFARLALKPGRLAQVLNSVVTLIENMEKLVIKECAEYSSRFMPLLNNWRDLTTQLIRSGGNAYRTCIMDQFSTVASFNSCILAIGQSYARFGLNLEAVASDIEAIKKIVDEHKLRNFSFLNYYDVGQKTEDVKNALRRLGKFKQWWATHQACGNALGGAITPNDIGSRLIIKNSRLYVSSGDSYQNSERIVEWDKPPKTNYSGKITSVDTNNRKVQMNGLDWWDIPKWKVSPMFVSP